MSHIARHEYEETMTRLKYSGDYRRMGCQKILGLTYEN